MRRLGIPSFVPLSLLKRFHPNGTSTLLIWYDEFTEKHLLQKPRYKWALKEGLIYVGLIKRMSQNFFPGFTANWFKMTVRNSFSADQPIKAAQPCLFMAFLNPINLERNCSFP